jgi:DNA-binding MarR family transcriptional regulator
MREDAHIPAGPESDLAREVRVVLGRLTRRLRGEGSAVGDLSWTQISVLQRLEAEGGQTVSTLARLEGMRPQSMGAAVAALEAAGLIEGAPDPQDGRQTRLFLTPACTDLMRSGRAAKEDWLMRTLQARFSEEERRELAHAMRLLGRLAAEGG